MCAMHALQYELQRRARLLDADIEVRERSRAEREHWHC